ncbi:murein L,D-transpeptidase [Sphingomonas populi]|uniref:Murein L,D-transpeptidase n=2 Tax=Sphingomonas populi TaxID=2484750 RepID=A0A4Q6XW61_9SPHN|nr:murein L,D-transpeptidase [Sphingomonas populi]
MLVNVRRGCLVTACGAVSLFALTVPLSAHAAAASGAGDAELPGEISEADLRAAVTDPATRRFYDRVHWRAVWNAAAIQALRQALSGRAAHGLDHVTFLQDSGADATIAQREAAFTGAALRYAAALGKGVVDPASLHSVYTLARPDLDVVGGLATALERGELARWLDGLAPQDAAYAKVSDAYLAAVAEAGQGDDAGPRIDTTGVVRAGDTDPRVPAIVRQLQAQGYMVAGGTSATPPVEGGLPVYASRVYTDRIVDAVRQMQRDYGLAEDGVLGPRTIAVLNLRPADRARAIAVALERLRWLARNPPATRIDVNIAAAILYYYRDGVLVDSRKVIVGKPGKETPMLLSPIYRLVANPTWTIPKSIERSELAHVGPKYLASHNMVRRGGYIVQRPGPDNALGMVKFDMINDRAIYLHDTSAPGLFERSQRHLSHGCVRVEGALGFAQRIAEDEGVADRWQSASAGGKHTFVDLPVRIPVRLLYQNAFVDEAGHVTVRADPYDWNGPVSRALGFDDGAHARAQADTVDIGP